MCLQSMGELTLCAITLGCFQVFLFVTFLVDDLARGGDFWEDQDAENYPAIDMNLTSLIKSTRLAISTFLKQSKPKDGGPCGIIINTASAIGAVPDFFAPVYAVSNLGNLITDRSNYRCDGIHQIHKPSSPYVKYSLLRIGFGSTPNISLV